MCLVWNVVSTAKRRMKWNSFLVWSTRTRPKNTSPFFSNSERKKISNEVFLTVDKIKIYQFYLDEKAILDWSHRLRWWVIRSAESLLCCFWGVGFPVSVTSFLWSCAVCGAPSKVSSSFLVCGKPVAKKFSHFAKSTEENEYKRSSERSCKVEVWRKKCIFHSIWKIHSNPLQNNP